jgi:outer membrane biosynthesis protein TonB
MKKNLFHLTGLLFALFGFLFFRLWPSTPPLSVAQDEYLQRVAAEQPTPAPAPAPVPVPVAVVPKPLAPPTVVPPPPVVPPAPVAAPVAVVAPEPKPTPPPVAAPVQQEAQKPAPAIAVAPKPEPKAVPVSPKPKPIKPNPATAKTLKKIDAFAATHGMTALAPGQGVNAQFKRKDVVVPGQKTGGVNDIYQSQSSALDAFQKRVEK